jgi:hypothetical protein
VAELLGEALHEGGWEINQKQAESKSRCEDENRVGKMELGKQALGAC